MSKWVDICPASELENGARKCLRAEGMPLAVFNVEGDLFAVQNICPHAGLPLGEGDLTGTTLTCPFHGFAYNIKSGKNVDFDGDVPLRTYPIKVEGDKVVVDLQPEAAAGQ